MDFFDIILYPIYILMAYPGILWRYVAKKGKVPFKVLEHDNDNLNAFYTKIVYAIIIGSYFIIRDIFRH